MVARALRAGEDRVVVGHHDRARLRLREQIAVDATDAGHHAVAGTLLDQLLQAAPCALRGERQRAVLDERAGIAQILDVLSCRALLRGASTRDRLGPLDIERAPLARSHFRQVATDVIEIDARRDFLARRARCPLHAPPGAARLPAPHRLPPPVISTTWPLAAASMTCSIFMDSITMTCWPLRTTSPALHVDADDRALHRRPEHGAVRSSACRHVGSVGRGTRLLAVMQDRERIARVDARTRQRGLRSGLRSREQARMPAVAGSKLARVPLDERGIDVVRFHCRMAQQVLQEPDVRRDAFDAELAQRAIRPLHRRR